MCKYKEAQCAVISKQISFKLPFEHYRLCVYILKIWRIMLKVHLVHFKNNVSIVCCFSAVPRTYTTVDRRMCQADSSGFHICIYLSILIVSSIIRFQTSGHLLFVWIIVTFDRNQPVTIFIMKYFMSICSNSHSATLCWARSITMVKLLLRYLPIKQWNKTNTSELTNSAFVRHSILVRNSRCGSGQDYALPYRNFVKPRLSFM